MTRNKFRRRFMPRSGLLALAGAAFAVAGGAAEPSAGQALPTAPVALTNQPAAGTGGNYALFGPASLNASGQVRFDALLSGLSVTAADDTAAFTSSPSGGGLRLLVREGQAAPGTDGLVFDTLFLGGGPVTREGQTVVAAPLRNAAGTPSGRGYFAGTPGDLRLMYRPGQFETVNGHPVINSGPRAVLWTQGKQNLVYWDGTASTPLATPAPTFQPTINGAGRIAFTMFSTDNDLPGGLYAGPPGDFRPVAPRGGAGPGLPAGHTFDLVLDASQNNAGQFAFLASAHSPAPDSYAWGLWAGRPGELRLLARDGQPAPGLPKGHRFGQVLFDIDSPTTPALGGAGHVPFWALIEDQDGSFSGTGVWLAHAAGGEPRLLGRTGDEVSATLPGGAETELSLGFFSPNAIWVNTGGQVVLVAESLAPGETDPAESLFAAGAGGALRLVARRGSPFEVAPGDVRLVAGVVPGFGFGTGGEDGRPSSFNDAGQVVYRLDFADGTSGLFVTTVPEPGAAALGAALAAALLARRPRGRAQDRDDAAEAARRPGRPAV